MSVLQNTKQHIKQAPHFKRRPHKGTDWLGVIVFFSLSVFVVLGLLQAVIAANVYVFSMDLYAQEAQEAAQFKYNAVHGGSTPEKTYEEARLALLNNDLKGVLDTIHPEYLDKYEKGLREAAAEGRLPEAGERLTPLKEIIDGDPKSIEVGDYVVYEIEPIPGNDSPNPLEGYSEAVEFVRDKYGTWKITGI